jgi:preprotein translocase subunit SecB
MDKSTEIVHTAGIRELVLFEVQLVGLFGLGGIAVVDEVLLLLSFVASEHLFPYACVRTISRSM